MQLKAKAVIGDSRFVIKDGIVCQLKGAGHTIVIPLDDTLKDRLLKLYHTTLIGGHLGVYWLVKVLSTRYYWCRMHAEIKNFVKRCSICQAAKVDT